MDLALVAAGVIAFAVLAYVVLDGFDLGVGILFPFAPDERARDGMMRAVSPLWDGNETWLVLGGVVLFGAFPTAYALLLPGLYLPLALMLLSFIFRGVAFEFRFQSAARTTWSWAFALGSLSAAVCQGLVLGHYIEGFRETAPGMLASTRILGGYTPFALLCGAALPTGYALLGAAWLAAKSGGEAQVWALRRVRPLVIAVAAFMAAVSLLTVALNAEVRDRWLAGLHLFALAPIPLAAAALGYALWRRAGAGQARHAYPHAAGLFLCGFAGLGASLFPNLVPPSRPIWDLAAPPESVGFLLVGVAIALPAVLAYTSYAYFVFRGPVRVRAEDDETVDAEVPHVLVIGGAGFGGLAIGHALAGAPVRVTLLDRRNHHLFQPLLYQVAAAQLSPADIAVPLRGVFAGQDNIDVRLGEAMRIDLDARQVELADGDALGYDYLVVATGARVSWFGHDAWSGIAPGLKDLRDALCIREAVLAAFEDAEQACDPARREALTTFVVVGGGATGVELAGALAEMARRTLTRDFRRIDTARARVVLVEAGDRLLPTFPEVLSAKARASLEGLGVEVRLGAGVEAIEPGCVTLGGGTRLSAETVLWGAGVATTILSGLPEPADKSGRIAVGTDLSIPLRPEVFVIGDAALSKGADGKPLPGVAPVAKQQGSHVAEAILAELEGERAAMPAFRYSDHGTLATIGTFAAVADFGRVRLSGALGKLVWVGAHILFLIDFRSRLSVASTWGWAVLTGGRAARLIERPRPVRSGPGRMDRPVPARAAAEEVA